jgi:hypothetical protein
MTRKRTFTQLIIKARVNLNREACHRAAGGEPDPIQEQLLREVRREDASPYN